MRIVLDTDVASNLIKNTLDPAFRAKIAPHEAAITFVTVGELTQWAHVRDLGARRRSELGAYIATRVKIPGGSDVGRMWGEITAYAQRRGRPCPINDSWIAACRMTYDLPLATLNKADFAAAVTACMDAGAFARTDPLTVSPEIWTAAHGIAPLLITKPSLPWGNKMAFATRVLRSAAIGHAASAKAPTWSPGSIMPGPVETRHRR